MLHVLESYFPCLGGAEKQVLTLSKYMIEKGSEPCVLVPKMSLNGNAPLDVVEGVPTKRIAFPRVPVFGTAILLINLSFYLLRNVKKFDAIHVHIANNIGGVACLISSLKGVTSIVKFTGLSEMEGGVLDPKKNTLRIKFLRWAYKKANYYQSTSTQIANRIEQNGFDKNKIVLLPNGVDMRTREIDVQKAEKLTKQYQLTNKLVGIYVGRLEKEKAPDSLIEAWAKSFENRDDVCLLVVGEGSLKNDLIAMVNKYNMDSQIHFVGYTTDVSIYMKVADFGILPSEYEGLSNTLLEFFTSGLPVIGSIVSGTEDVVSEGETGWLFPPRDIDLLASKLTQAHSRGKAGLKEMGIACRSWIEDYAGLSNVYDRLSKLYGW